MNLWHRVLDMPIRRRVPSAAPVEQASPLTESVAHRKEIVPVCGTQCFASESGEACGSLALEQSLSLILRNGDRKGTALGMASAAKRWLAGACQFTSDRR